MLPAYIAARELERRQARNAAEFARQLPLYAEETAQWQPPIGDDPAWTYPERREPDWVSDY